MDLEDCVISGTRSSRSRQSVRRSSRHRMALPHNEFGNHTTGTEPYQQDNAPTQPPIRTDDKREDTNENMEVIEISDNEEVLGVRDVPAAQHSELIDNQLAHPTQLPVPSAYSQNESFSFDSATRISGAELLPSPAERSGLSSSFNSLNVSVFSKTYNIDIAKISPTPGTSSRSSCTQSNDAEQWKLRLNQPEEFIEEIFETPSIPVGKMANKLIKLSRYLRTPSSHDLNCLSCNRIPTSPVTGKCGHTRCKRCTILKSTCPCGTPSIWIPRENTAVREIIEKMTSFVNSSRSSKISKLVKSDVETSLTQDSFKFKICQRRFAPNRGVLQFSRPRIPITADERYTQAQQFISMGLYAEAAPHLARAAASFEPCSNMARRLLDKTVKIVCQERGERLAWRVLSSSIREQSMHSWLAVSDLECVLCTNPYRDPVSTPCGHTFCRVCIERGMYYSRRCALCSSSLDRFILSDTQSNVFFSALLKLMDVPPLPLEPDVVPIVISYVTFPGMPCPLFIKKYRHWLMVLRILKAGSRRFGMLSYERDHALSDYGIILEIRDCVVFKDNKCIVSTIGISRFKVVERDVRDGCDVARVRLLVDSRPTKEEVSNIQVLTETVVNKAMTWVDSMTSTVREEIETAFGSWPLWQEIQQQWWIAPHGPVWLWWLVAILPLKKAGKVHILSTENLLSRMLAILRTFEIMDESIL